MREIYENFWRHSYHRRGAPRWQAEQAACDVLDGWVRPCEWKPLVKKGLLVSVPTDEGSGRYAVLSAKGLFLMHHWRRVAQLRAA